MTDRYYDKGQMVDHCICLLAYVSRHRMEPQSITRLAKRCNIPYSTLYTILGEAYLSPDCSLLKGVAMNYGYEFHVYSSWNSLSFPSPKGVRGIRVIDVVKLNGSEKYKYDNGHYYE